jgi:hypothetical protein
MSAGEIPSGQQDDDQPDLTTESLFDTPAPDDPLTPLSKAEHSELLSHYTPDQLLDLLADVQRLRNEAMGKAAAADTAATEARKAAAGQVSSNGQDPTLIDELSSRHDIRPRPFPIEIAANWSEDRIRAAIANVRERISLLES